MFWFCCFLSEPDFPDKNNKRTGVVQGLLDNLIHCKHLSTPPLTLIYYNGWLLFHSVRQTKRARDDRNTSPDTLFWRQDRRFRDKERKEPVNEVASKREHNSLDMFFLLACSTRSKLSKVLWTKLSKPFGVKTIRKASKQNFFDKLPADVSPAFLGWQRRGLHFDLRELFASNDPQTQKHSERHPKVHWKHLHPTTTRQELLERELELRQVGVPKGQVIFVSGRITHAETAQILLDGMDLYFQKSPNGEGFGGPNMAGDVVSPMV